MERDFYETDVSGEINEARELDHLHECEMRDIEQGIQPCEGDDE
jgi:hypothetical protein